MADAGDSSANLPVPTTSPSWMGTRAGRLLLVAGQVPLFALAVAAVLAGHVVLGYLALIPLMFLFSWSNRATGRMGSRRVASLDVDELRVWASVMETTYAVTGGLLIIWVWSSPAWAEIAPVVNLGGIYVLAGIFVLLPEVLLAWRLPPAAASIDAQPPGVDDAIA